MIDSIEPAIIKLVQEAPVQDPATVRALQAALECVSSPLARSIARIVELLAEQLVDPGVALPALAEACATLVAAERGDADPGAVEAARYRIETLQPVPDPPPGLGVPDVPLWSISRGPRPRT